MLKIKSLSKKIDCKTLLSPFSLEIASSSLYSLIGANGSGKSTFLKLLSGILEPSTGSIFYEDTNILNLQRKEWSKLFSLVLQNPQTPFAYTVEEILHMSSYAGNPPLSLENQTFLFEELGIYPLLNSFITELSQGEKMRCFILKALLANTPILLLDEPFASLDVYYQLKLWKILKKLSNEGKLVITATHDLLSAKNFSEETLFLHLGALVFKGSLKSKEGEKAIQDHLKITFSPEENSYLIK